MEANKMDTNLNMIPALDRSYDLKANQIEGYQQNGHICLREVASSEEIDVYGDAIRTKVQELNYHTKPVHERDTYGKAFIQIGNVWEQSEVVKRFVMARRFAKIAADLMGVDGVRIYHDQALFKEPGGGHTPWHQDQIYWPFDTNKTITMWMPIVPATEEMGTMTFASGSHKSGYINKMVISDESHRTLQEYIDGKGFGKVTHGAMAAGDATFHSGWTLHSAPANPTDNMREVMTIIYFADGTRAVKPDSNARKNDLKQWLPGINPGELAASHLNPLVYSSKY
jgi:ectoine hydroxylase-related dioxygenase (phytanoyl-CoA dioxygenase family)